MPYLCLSPCAQNRALNFLVRPSEKCLQQNAHDVLGRTFISGVCSTTDQVSIFSRVLACRHAAYQYSWENSPFIVIHHHQSGFSTLFPLGLAVIKSRQS